MYQMILFTGNEYLGTEKKIADKRIAFIFILGKKI